MDKIFDKQMFKKTWDIVHQELLKIFGDDPSDQSRWQAAVKYLKSEYEKIDGFMPILYYSLSPFEIMCNDIVTKKYDKNIVALRFKLCTRDMMEKAKKEVLEELGQAYLASEIYSAYCDNRNKYVRDNPGLNMLEIKPLVENSIKSA